MRATTLGRAACALGTLLVLALLVGGYTKGFLDWRVDGSFEGGPKLQSIFTPFPKAEVFSTLLSNSDQSRAKAVAAVPTVLVPGMGDSCFNPGFSQLTSLVASRTNRNANCYGPGEDVVTDPVYSFTKTMDEQVDHFASKVKENIQLASGFNAMGLSQGNLVIRAYIQRYNDPPVLNFISVHGPHAGVASVPRCDPGHHFIFRELCDLLDYLLGDFVYTPAIQSSVAQSNYFRDPLKINSYRQGCAFLPDVLDNPKADYKTRFTQLKKLALVMAEADTMIFPKESEIFAAFADGGWSDVIEAAAQPWYTSLGLKELDQSNRITVLKTQGDHLRFSITELNNWIDQFFMN